LQLSACIIAWCCCARATWLREREDLRHRGLAPGQGSYLEVSSCSNCEDSGAPDESAVQGRNGEINSAHPNGSGTALARLFVSAD